MTFLGCQASTFDLKVAMATVDHPFGRKFFSFRNFLCFNTIVGQPKLVQINTEHPLNLNTIALKAFQFPHG